MIFFNYSLVIITANLEITDRKMHLSASASSGESIRLLRKNPFQMKVGLKPNVTKSGQTKAKNKSSGYRNRFVFVSSHTFGVVCTDRASRWDWNRNDAEGDFFFFFWGGGGYETGFKTVEREGISTKREKEI